MNKRLVMWGTFLVVFLASVAGSYQFINRNNKDMTIELSAPTLPLVSTVVQGESFNTMHGYTSDMDISDVAAFIIPVGENRVLEGQIEPFGAQIKEARYEVRNNDGSRLIESGTIGWEEKKQGVLDFSVRMKDLIVSGEEYLFTVILTTDSQEKINYYTRFIYGNTYDLDAQLAFVKEFHANTFDKEKKAEIAVYMETDRNRDNTSLAHVDITSSSTQIVWGNLAVEEVTEPQIDITYLQDNYGAYTLRYYVSAVVNDRTEYFYVEEDFLVSTYGEKIYLLDYERTANSIFKYEEDLYQNNKIYLSIQNDALQTVESEDGNMAAFVVNRSLYYYDDNSNEMNYVYGFMDDMEERSAYFHHDIKVLQVSENGSIYFVVYGYMNRGNHEGRVGMTLYYYNGQTRLVEEVGFYETAKSAEYLMQEIRELAYLSRHGLFYFVADGNVVSCDVQTGDTEVVIAYQPHQTLYISKDQSCVAADNGREVAFWQLETGVMRSIQANGGRIVPQGFIGNDFVYGIAKETDNVLQSDGTYASYMSELRIQDAQGEIQKQYVAEGILIRDCVISGNQILLERVYDTNGNMAPAPQDQIVTSKGTDDNYNQIESVKTETCQTIYQVALKNKIDTSSLKFAKAQEVFLEGHRLITVDAETQKESFAVYSPWRVEAYVTDAGEAMRKADALGGSSRDADGLVVWKKAATVVKNQIMAIELEAADSERSSKKICLDIMRSQIGSPLDAAEELAKGKTCQEILDGISGEYQFMDVTGSSLTGLLYYLNQDIPVMVLYENGEALLLTGFNQFNVVVMDPVSKKLGYMSRSDTEEMLEETNNQVFTYYRKMAN